MLHVGASKNVSLLLHGSTKEVAGIFLCAGIRKLSLIADVHRGLYSVLEGVPKVLMRQNLSSQL